MQLRQLQKGQCGIIRKITVAGHLGLRLREMGFTSGAHVQIDGRAPLNDPVRLRLNGQSMTLRNNEADHIEVDLP